MSESENITSIITKPKGICEKFKEAFAKAKKHFPTVLYLIGIMIIFAMIVVFAYFAHQEIKLRHFPYEEFHPNRLLPTE